MKKDLPITWHLHDLSDIELLSLVVRRLDRNHRKSARKHKLLRLIGKANKHTRSTVYADLYAREALLLYNQRKGKQ